MRIAAALVFAASVMSNAHAAGAARQQEPKCDPASVTQYDMDVCAGQDFKKADDALNALYRKMLPRYNATDQTLLKDAERKWLAWRDAECAFDTNLSMGGTMHPMVETMCQTEKTKARVKELEAQLKCTDGDTSCNPPDK